MIRVKKHLAQIERPRAGVPPRYSLQRFDKNERWDAYPEGWVRGVLDSLSAVEVNAYPEPERVYQALHASLGVPLETLLLTAGADGAIRTAFDVCDWSRGGALLCVDPTFAMVDVYARIFNVRKKAIGYRKRTGALPELGIADLIAGLGDSISLAVLANPNSPTGTMFTAAELRGFIAAAERQGTLVLIDETYSDFSGVSVVDLTGEFANLMVAGSLSKGVGLAGLRLGYLVSSAELRASCFAVKPMYEGNAAALAFAERALAETHIAEDYGRLVQEAALQLAAFSRRMGFDVLTTPANFMYILVGRKTQALLARAEERGILLRAGMGVPGYEEWLRVSLAPWEALQPIRDLLGEFGNGSPEEGA